MVDEFTNPCTQRIQQICINLEKHQISEYFYVVNMGDRRCGFRHSMEVCFQHNGTDVILQGLTNGSPKIASS